MQNGLATTKFDYSPFDGDVKGKLIWYAAEVQKLGKSHVESGLEMGRLLSEARELCGEKPFREWVSAECNCSLRTAYNYISAFSEFGECANLARIELSAMYELTKNEIAKKRAIKLAEKGTTVTYSIAKKLIGEASPPKPRAGSDGKPKPPEKPDYGKCPCCAGTKWDEPEEEGEPVSCSKCHHPHGEPAGDPDDDRVKTQRQKTVKTIEALMRAFDDLHTMSANPKHDSAIKTCKELLAIAKGWK